MATLLAPKSIGSVISKIYTTTKRTKMRRKSKPIMVAVNPPVFKTQDARRYADAIAQQLAVVIAREGNERKLDGKKAVVAVRFSFVDEYGKALRRR
jgi:hypothetical protein